jgi:hypothetical protein
VKWTQAFVAAADSSFQGYGFANYLVDPGSLAN